MNMPRKCGLRAKVKLKDGRLGKVVARSTFQNKTGNFEDIFAHFNGSLGDEDEANE